MADAFRFFNLLLTVGADGDGKLTNTVDTFRPDKARLVVSAAAYGNLRRSNRYVKACHDFLRGVVVNFNGFYPTALSHLSTGVIGLPVNCDRLVWLPVTCWH